MAMELFLLVTVTVLSTVRALPTVPVLKPEDPSTAAVPQVQFLKPSDSERLEVVEAENLDAIVVEAGETTTFQPQRFDPSDCFLPKEKGPCRALLDAYFFNSVTNSCELFSWSGCGGNANRFTTYEICEVNCKQTTSNPPIKQKILNQEDLTPPTSQSITNDTLPSSSPSTELPTEVAPSGLRPKPVAKLPPCPKFSGCGPKCVIIQDRSDRGCKKCLCGDPSDAGKSLRDLPGPVVVSSGNITVSKTTQVSTGSVSGLPKDAEEEPILGNPSENCKLPTRRGDCRGMMTRYHYDPAIKDCTVFHYGGCDGNLNNFVSKEKCLEYCKGQ